MSLPVPVPVSTLKRGVAATWFYLAILLFLLIGWRYPEVGRWMKHVNATPMLVALVFFLNGMTLSTSRLVDSLRRWPVLLISLVLTFVAAPVVVWLARHWLPDSNSSLALGFQLLSLVPTTLVSAVVLTRVAKCDVAVALYISVLANIAAIVVIPTLAMLTLNAPGVQLDLPGMVQSLIYTVLAPITAGQIIRQFAAPWIDRHTRTLGTISQITILFFILSGMSALPKHQLTPALIALVGGACLLFHLVLLGIADLTARLLRIERAVRIALAFSTGQKSLVLTLSVYGFLFRHSSAGSLVVLPAILYYIIELALDSILAQWLGRHPGPVEPPVVQELEVVTAID